jgi:mRNA-degrading endonuclease toxin of MazEF toxin-antitoxin module
MPAVNPGEVWMMDFGMAAKVRPALILTGEPADEELDLVTVLLHTTALRGNRWELNSQTVSETGRVPRATNPIRLDGQVGAQAWRADSGRDESGAGSAEQPAANLR